MRHADKPTVEVELHVDASPERLWPLVTDITLLTMTSEELRTVEWEAEGAHREGAHREGAHREGREPGADGPAGAALGRRFVGTSSNRHFGEWQTTSTVVECDEPRAFAWAVGDVLDPNTTWRFTIRPDGDGAVLTQWMQLGTGPSGITVAIERMPDKEERIIERRLEEFRAAMQANLVAIKEIAERPAP